MENTKLFLAINKIFKLLACQEFAAVCRACHWFAISALDSKIAYCSSCHNEMSLESAAIRILPNYIVTYIPITTVMIANPCLYNYSTKDLEQIITSTAGQLTSRERDIIDAIKVKFSMINAVFYICWLPNLVNGFVLWTLWFHLPITCVISLWYVMVSILIICLLG